MRQKSYYPLLIANAETRSQVVPDDLPNCSQEKKSACQVILLVSMTPVDSKTLVIMSSTASKTKTTPQLSLDLKGSCSRPKVDGQRMNETLQHSCQGNGGV